MKTSNPSSKNAPLISFIIPAFNAEVYLEECVTSIIKCPCELLKIEVIIVNDGSTDKTHKICNTLSERDDRIVVINTVNRGASNARNLGIRQSAGTYISFVDSDDKLADSWWRGVRWYQLRNDLIYLSYNAHEEEHAQRHQLFKKTIGAESGAGCYSAPFSKLYKRSLIIKHSIFFDSSLTCGEDMLFNIKCIASFNDFALIRHSFYIYRERPGSTTKKYRKDFLQNDKAFHVLLARTLSLASIPKDLTLFMRTFCAQSAIISGLYNATFRGEPFSNKDFEFLKNEPYLSSLNQQILLTGKNRIILSLVKIKAFRLSFYLLSQISLRVTKRGAYEKQI